ncbi:hypothetical protein B0T24DRAFT_33271 [Lasiosphaeria ovina]|uniref:Uncharacterized protein n=1 Tax=Lasiosphaeria ovina TaxID=92902 RepID=A0AAE0TXH7_9PEZI|nr:hypothetical protein B0T24DRAFT_33271 [Lasiosphaeria ovina]
MGESAAQRSNPMCCSRWGPSNGALPSLGSFLSLPLSPSRSLVSALYLALNSLTAFPVERHYVALSVLHQFIAKWSGYTAPAGQLLPVCLSRLTAFSPVRHRCDPAERPRAPPGLRYYGIYPSGTLCGFTSIQTDHAEDVRFAPSTPPAPAASYVEPGTVIRCSVPPAMLLLAAVGCLALAAHRSATHSLPP